MKRAALSLLLLAGLIVPALAADNDRTKDEPHETPAQRDARMKWWRNARFGLFVHWGLYAVPAGEYRGKAVPGIGEWIMASADIPREEYEKFAREFNPVKYDPDEWVRTAKDAGMGYIVITSKHHDGFCLWDTKATDYNVVKATPYGKDLLKPLSEACKRAGLKFCVYYSILDWHHPAQYLDPDARTKGKPRDAYAKDRIHPDRKAEYVDYMKTQLKELITNDDPAVLWFDGEWQDWWTEEDARDLYRYLKALKPDLIINNRIGKGREGMQGLSKGPGYTGDFGTPEQQIPATGLPGVDWESCMTMNDTWGYKSADEHWKSSATLIRDLVDIASKGGNFLLNVGPTPDGLIPKASVERLHDIGAWMKANGEATHGTTASPFPTPAWGRYTKADGRLYAHVFDWPKDGRLEVPPVRNKVAKAYLLAQRDEPLRVEQTEKSAVVVRLPETAPDPVASVVVLEFEGPLEVIRP